MVLIPKVLFNHYLCRLVFFMLGISCKALIVNSCLNKRTDRCNRLNKNKNIFQLWLWKLTERKLQRLKKFSEVEFIKKFLFIAKYFCFLPNKVLYKKLRSKFTVSLFIEQGFSFTNSTKMKKFKWFICYVLLSTSSTPVFRMDRN